MHLLEQLPGIIWAGFMGLVIGNFTTSPIYRLPRSEPLFTRDPFCDSCHAPLKPRDLFPVLSWLMNRGLCRYCKARIPSAYTVTEAFVCLLFILCYLHFGFSELFLLVALGMTSFVMIAMMLKLDNFFSDRTLIAGIVLGMLYRTLIDGTIYGFAGAGFAGLMAGVILWKLSKRPLVRNISEYPSYVKLLVAAGVWLPLIQLPGVLLAMGIASLLAKDKKWLMEFSIMACVMIETLYSHLMVSL